MAGWVRARRSLTTMVVKIEVECRTKSTQGKGKSGYPTRSKHNPLAGAECRTLIALFGLPDICELGH